MTYLIVISVSFSAGFVVGIMFARHNAAKIDSDIAKVQDIKSKL